MQQQYVRDGQTVLLHGRAHCTHARVGRTLLVQQLREHVHFAGKALLVLLRVLQQLLRLEQLDFGLLRMLRVGGFVCDDNEIPLYLAFALCSHAHQRLLLHELVGGVIQLRLQLLRRLLLLRYLRHG